MSNNNVINKLNLITDSFYHIYNGYLNLCACCSYPFPSTLKTMSIPIYLAPTEGLPDKRYFPAFDFLEKIEKDSETILLKLFNTSSAQYGATIQPHSGTQANQIVYNAVLSQNDIVLSLSPKEGGHISHSKLAGKGNKVINYHLTDSDEINYAEIENLCNIYKPKLIIVGTSSYSTRIDFKKVSNIAHKYQAYILADICHWVLFILGNTVESCIPYVDFVTFTLDKLLRGPQGGILIFKKEYEQDINYSVFPVSQGGPLQSSLFAKYACLNELLSISIPEYASIVNDNANLLATTLNSCGVNISSKKIDNHIILINTIPFGFSGDIAEDLLFKARILCNKNQIPNDKRSVDSPSGIRLGSTCITNLNFSPEDVVVLGEYIANILKGKRIYPKLISSLMKKYLISPVGRQT